MMGEGFMTADEFSKKCLFLDLESVPKGDVYHIGAVFGEQRFERSASHNMTRSLHELDEFAAAAEFVAGHNILSHDIPLLRKRWPHLAFLDKPLIDTLFLSAIAFPQNPYHRLLKDYKLVKDTKNNPVRDAELSACLLKDEWEELGKLCTTEPEAISFYRHCFATAPASLAGTKPGIEGLSAATGFDRFFAEMGVAKASELQACQYAQTELRESACLSAAKSLFNGFREPVGGSWHLAYCLAWLRVAGDNSVLPPWVRHQFPCIVDILKILRETPCEDPACSYCRAMHNPRTHLKDFFGFDDFRPQPANDNGGSLQADIVLAGMQNEPLLAILPTGGGKSLCFQLPALARYLRRGMLTIVISPLQALMKDQVDNLNRKTHNSFAAALYGMLTPPERGDTLDRVRLGEIAILYVSPEQLRNRSFQETIKSREVGCWVFDEAHCLSKWGHDFRPDYLYAGRFIREFVEKSGQASPAVACYTATAKQDVIAEISAFFLKQLQLDLRVFRGGVERNNLSYAVETVTSAEKLERIHHILTSLIPADTDGAAVIFRSRRQATEDTSAYLRTKGWSCQHFHAGLKSPEKRGIQDEFIAGNLQVICATNAFGMGIDKDNVRVVIHADIPGSLENYLQEAGRAGRDQQHAQCILLFDEADLEKQFQMGAYSELTKRDIGQILKGLKKAARSHRKEEIVLTSGELLSDESLITSIDAEDKMADTKVKTAISWLERTGFVERNQNHTNVFQGKPLVSSLEEGRQRLSKLGLPATKEDLYLAILRQIFNMKDDEGASADELAQLSEFKSLYPADKMEERRRSGQTDSLIAMRILNDMAKIGLIDQGLLMTAFLRHKVKGHSQATLTKILEIDRKLLEIMQEAEPDPEGWQTLSLRSLNQRLLDTGLVCTPDLVLQLLKSLGGDGKDVAGGKGSLTMQYKTRDQYRVKLQRTWDELLTTAELRRETASVVLGFLLGKIPNEAEANASVLVDFSEGELVKAVENDLALRAQISDYEAAVMRALLFLHEQHVIILQQGLAIFRQAMTIRVPQNAQKKNYLNQDYAPLAEHYGERMFQIHVMDKYAKVGIKKMQDALGLVNSYFAKTKTDFINAFFADNKKVLNYATTVTSHRQIVESLNNPEQQAIVTAPVERNMLVLAGPGSGKTRVVAHRCAYLVKVKRARPQSILVLCFNRKAALSLRQRIKALLGDDMFGITIQTYHGLAMRLTGRSFAAHSANDASTGEFDFESVIRDAITLLKGEKDLPGLDQDDIRDRLLQGYEHILVDEYQDVDELQYAMVSAIAGRTEKEAENKLSIMAVGDDDQNIYSFRGASVQYIRRFEEDYKATRHYLVENYRSTEHLIAAGNALIFQNHERMKIRHPIQINRARKNDPPGGLWQHLDPLARGRVQILEVSDTSQQALALLGELRRLKSLYAEFSWKQCAVLARTRQELGLVRTVLEQAGIPLALTFGKESAPPLFQIREIADWLQSLRSQSRRLCRATDLKKQFATWRRLSDCPPPTTPEPGHTSADEHSRQPSWFRTGNPWFTMLEDILAEWHQESSNAEVPMTNACDFFYEALLERRHSGVFGEGVLLATAHAVKGLEFDHVFILDGGWQAGKSQQDREEERRVYYVGMTRARQGLCLFRKQDLPISPASLPANSASITRRTIAPIATAPGILINRHLETLGMRDLFLDFAGHYPTNAPVHRALASLKPGDLLQATALGQSIFLQTRDRISVARLAKEAQSIWAPKLGEIQTVRVLALVRRQAGQSKPEYAERCRVDHWEIPLVEIASLAKQTQPLNRPTLTLLNFDDIRGNSAINALPIVADLAAGPPLAGFAVGNLDSCRDCQWVRIPERYRGQSRFVIRVAGHSMEPTLHLGDLVICEYHRSPNANGQIVIAANPEFGLDSSGSSTQAIKRLRQTAAAWHFESDNPEYPGFSISKMECEHPILGIALYNLSANRHL
jgi:ATP-dependent DNA helicase RecQ